MVFPVIELYAIMGVQTIVTGGGWFPRTPSLSRDTARVTVFKHVAFDSTPRSAIFFTVLSAGVGLLLGLNDQAVATIIAFGTGGLYAMFTITTRVRLYTRLTGRWDPTRGS